MTTLCIILPHASAAETAIAIDHATSLLEELRGAQIQAILLTLHSFPAAARISNARHVTVDELLASAAPDEHIPARSFRNPAAHASYRIAIALRRLLGRSPEIGGIEFQALPTTAYFTLKWRRLWGDEFAGIPIWINPPSAARPSALPAVTELPLAFERRKDARREEYVHRHADPSPAPISYAQFLQPRATPAATVAPTTPLVSILIPYYEAHAYIDATLDSVLAGTYHEWEILLINDGSSSAAAQAKFAALRQRFAADARFRFFEQPNAGLAATRNAGLRQAKGTLILPLDSDDLIAPAYLARAVQSLVRNPDLAAVSSFATTFVDGAAPTSIAEYILPYDLDPVLIAIENLAGVACSVFRRDVFERFSYDESFRSLEDWDLWWSMAEAGLVAEVMPQVLYRYRRRVDSLINAMPTATRAELLRRLQQKHAHHLQTHGDQIAQCYAEWIQEWQLERAARDHRLRFAAPFIRIAKTLRARLFPRDAC